MKKFKFLIALFALFYITAAIAESPDAFDIYDKPIYKSALGGKTLIINYWSESCGPCIDEIPELNKLNALSQKDNFALFAININNLSASEQQIFAGVHHMDYAMFQTNPFTNINYDAAVEILPTTFIVPPKGKIIKLEGEQTAADILSALRS